MTPKCDNCKFAGHNQAKSKSIPHDACCLNREKVYHRIRKYTSNSKYFTHCNLHEFKQPKR